jgi:hypothetical protein
MNDGDSAVFEVKAREHGKALEIDQANNPIDLYEAATHEYLPTVTLGADMTARFDVPPAPPAMA